jgi:hypothetical protein
MEWNPEKLLGFSKFADLQPKKCMLAEVSSIQALCGCTFHQNVKCIISGEILYDLTERKVKTCDCPKLSVMCQA